MTAHNAPKGLLRKPMRLQRRHRTIIKIGINQKRVTT